MDETKKRYIIIVIIVIIVVCACLAVLFSVKSLLGGDEGGIGSISASDKIWIKCENPKCKAVYETSKRGFLQKLKDIAYSKPRVRAPACEKCGENTAYEAVKCQKCGFVFRSGSIRFDFSDRCLECGYSETETQRNQ